MRADFRERWERERAEARAEGKVEGKAEAILAVLGARGLSVSEPVRTQVLGCRDLGLLQRWLVRAASAASDSEVVAA